jgi:hypothetical protein
MKFNYSKIQWSILGAPYSREGRGALRIEVFRNPQQCKVDDKPKHTRNLVYWNYKETSPMMNSKCIDEVIPLSITLACFEQAFGVTQANHLEYAKEAGMVGILTPESFMPKQEDDYIDPSLVISDNGPSVNIQGR